MIESEAGEPDTAPQWQIHSIGIDGDVAVVRVEDDWVGSNFLDVLILLRHGGKWVIVSKAFHVRHAE